MLDHQYFSDPTPHLFLPQVLPPALYAQLKFPTMEPKPKGRIGRDLYAGEPGYDELVTSPGWRELHGMFTSREFVLWIVSRFARDMDRLNCAVGAEKAAVEGHVEPRDLVYGETEGIDDRDPNVLFTRFDIQAADGKYEPYVHLDHPRRLTGGLLFCSDHREEGLEGGEFALYRDRFPGNDRRCAWPILEKKFPVRHNTGVIFLNANVGFHGPRRTRALQGFRKWVYYSISSHRAIWTAEAPGTARNLVVRAGHKIGGVKQRLARLGR